MTEEEKAKLEAEAKAEAEAQDAEFEASLEGLSDEEKESKRAEREAAKAHFQIDYEAELKKERKARLRAEADKKKLEEEVAGDAYKYRRNKREEEEVDDPERDDEKPLTARQLEIILARERQATRQELQHTEASRLIKSKTTSEAEAQLAEEVFSSMVFPPHYSLEDKVDSVVAVINRNRLLGERNEALRALNSRRNAEVGAAETHHDAPKPGEPKIPSDELQVLKQQGFVWNITSRQYEKKISGGRTLVRDSKTKRVRLVKT